MPRADIAGELNREDRPRARGTARRLTKDELTRLVAGYREGATVYDLAERFKIHRTTVSGHLHRQGVRMRGRRLEEYQIDHATLLYEQGWSVARIGRGLSVDGSTVWRALRARGERMRKP